MEGESTFIRFAIVGGTLVDFNNLDLSPWGIKASLINSKAAKMMIMTNSLPKLADNIWKELVKISKNNYDGGVNPNWEFMNILWPLDFNNPPTERDYFEVIEAIKLIHPSELHVDQIICSTFSNGKIIGFEFCERFFHFHWYKYDDPEQHYFIYPENYLKETNEFLKYYKENYKKREYIANSIEYYQNSFKVNSMQMSFVCLCICLETIVPGNEQLSYRLRRNLAVLCSDSKQKGKKVYERVKKLYEIRSKLVHSGLNSKEIIKLNLWFKYAQILASRMIIEMLLHDIPTINELDSKLTELGFGQRIQISENYQVFIGNIDTWNKVSNFEI